ncbi:hypothetical protein KIN20_024395 [Parelaphostrongylus tenuis]|uniref:Glycoside hydrolase family 38 N-terminal domain-containing protein n=1 Tax=Parelaphostrongylus tenuis TaxID=148309 RepID=A0AAD5MTD4_PARTN|nr:hypothetical protein KIN20_024395 [Parelaphostrongylus tenuis]
MNIRPHSRDKNFTRVFVIIPRILALKGHIDMKFAQANTVIRPADEYFIGILPLYETEVMKIHLSVVSAESYEGNLAGEMSRYSSNIYSIGIICTFFIVCLYLYHSIDTKAAPGGSYLLQTDGIDKMKEKVDQLQTILENNRNEISSLKQELVDLEKKNENEWDKRGGNKIAVVHDQLRKTTATSFSSAIILKNFQMLDVYDLLAFDNPDGGAWKQGWEVTYDKSKVAGEKTLQVIVIPHSHCDPGWLKTFEQYHLDQTSKILDGMVKHLSDATVDMRFIYAEMSFFRTVVEKSD